MTIILDLVGSNVNDADENYNGPTSMSLTINKTYMQSEQYIPYSIRNNITDIEIGKLLDYLEREMGHDIVNYVPANNNTDYGWMIISDRLRISQHGDDVSITEYYRLVREARHTRCFSDMPTRLFFSTYKTLIPAIRNIYK